MNIPEYACLLQALDNIKSTLRLEVERGNTNAQSLLGRL